MVLALVIASGIYLASDWIAQIWIKADTLDLSTLIYCIGLMGVMIGLRWFAGLYRSGINGMEDQVWLSAANIMLISFKFIGVFENFYDDSIYGNVSTHYVNFAYEY